MQDVFITKIHIDKVRHLQNVDIVLPDNERKHLILTGKNGSGKTSLLEAMRNNIISKQKLYQKTQGSPISKKYTHEELNGKSGVDISYSQNISNFLGVMFVYISTGRSELISPEGIMPMIIKGKTEVIRNASKDFLRYILSLDYQLYGAKTDGNKALAENLEKWFDNFVIALREIYDCQSLKLQRDTKNLAFKIKMPGREPFKLSEMSDGYTAFLNIYMELLMRFESADAIVESNQPAIVMIDELETHLHVELQKRILPFLTKLKIFDYSS